MNITQKIVNKIVSKYNRNALELLQSEKKLKNAIEDAISDIQFEERGISVFTSTSAFNSAYYQSIKVDVQKVQEQIAAEVVNQLYIQNLITEREYKEICRTQ